MEEMMNSIKNMLKKLHKEEDSDKYYLFCPRYNSKVKILDWYLPQEANPKDNDPYHPPGGNYFLSTYNRLGTDDVKMESETDAMLKQICLREKDIELHKPMITSTTEQLICEEDEKYCKEGECFEMDFTTTYNYEFRDPYPYKKHFRPWKQQVIQKRFPIKSQFDSTKIPKGKFIDDEFYDIKPNTSYQLQPPYV